MDHPLLWEQSSGEFASNRLLHIGNNSQSSNSQKQAKALAKRQTWTSLHNDFGAKIRRDRAAWQSSRVTSSWASFWHKRVLWCYLPTLKWEDKLWSECNARRGQAGRSKNYQPQGLTLRDTVFKPKLDLLSSSANQQDDSNTRAITRNIIHSLFIRLSSCFFLSISDMGHWLWGTIW